MAGPKAAWTELDKELAFGTDVVRCCIALVRRICAVQPGPVSVRKLMLARTFLLAVFRMLV
jgi:hypothetical protein